MGLPIKITNPKEIPPGHVWTVSEEDLKLITEQNEALANIRGRVISVALLVEQKLDDIISLIFMGNNLNGTTLFKELLLNKEFFTFMSKWRLFRDLTNLKIINIADEKVRKKILTLIKDVIEIRDKFAHGDIVFSGTQPQLYYIRDGEKKYDILDAEYFKNLDTIFGQSLFFLEDIYKFLRGERPVEKKSEK
jgi:hypothetical protein